MPKKNAYKGNRNLKKTSRKSNKKRRRKSKKTSRKSTLSINSFTKDLISDVKSEKITNNSNPMMNQMGNPMMNPMNNPMMNQMSNPMMNQMGAQINPQNVDPLHLNYMVPVNQNHNINNFGIGYDQLSSGPQQNAIGNMRSSSANFSTGMNTANKHLSLEQPVSQPVNLPTSSVEQAMSQVQQAMPQVNQQGGFDLISSIKNLFSNDKNNDNVIIPLLEPVSQENQKSLGLEQQVAKTVPVAQAEQVAQVEKTQ